MNNRYRASLVAFLVLSVLVCLPLIGHAAEETIEVKKIDIDEFNDITVRLDRRFALSANGLLGVYASEVLYADQYAIADHNVNASMLFSIPENDQFSFLVKSKLLISADGNMVFAGVSSQRNTLASPLYEPAIYGAFTHDLTTGAAAFIAGDPYFHIVPQDINHDGSILLFTAYSLVAEELKRHVYLRDQSSGVTTQLLEVNSELSGLSDARFSDDTRFVVVSGTSLDIPGAGLTLLDRVKGSSREIVPGSNLVATGSVQISGNGEYLAYMATSGEGKGFVIYDVRNEVGRRIEKVGQQGTTWIYPLAVSMSGDGRYIANGNFIYDAVRDVIVNISSLDFNDQFIADGITRQAQVSDDGKQVVFIRYYDDPFMGKKAHSFVMTNPLYTRPICTLPDYGPAADFNGDFKVNALDLSILSAHLNVVVVRATKCDGDANGDGAVTIVDVGTLGGSFGKLPSQPGDVNRDGCVDDLDRQIISKNYLKKPTRGAADGDLNLDGLVTRADLRIWKDFEGQGCSS